MGATVTVEGRTFAETTVAGREVPTASVGSSGAATSIPGRPTPTVNVTLPGPAGPAGAGTAEITILAGATLSGHRAVKELSDGTVVYASKDTLGDRHAPIWLTLGAAASGTPVTVQTYGEVTEPSWAWTSGQPIWLGANGLLTQVIPSTGFVLQVASALEPTVLYWEPKVPIVLT